MKKQKFSEDPLITQSSNSVRKYSDPIPVDLLIDIFSRVPAKSIARFRCVSKLWESILGRSDFTELFLTKSVARPRLFFVVEVNELELLVFSSPQNPNDNSSIHVAIPYKSFPKYFPSEVFTPHCGLIFLRDRESNPLVICNPATGESITLPKLKATNIGDSYFGFDPISKQYKVLCMTWSCNGLHNTCQVLTLKTGKSLWRTIKDPLPYDTTYCNEICINGVLYYKVSIEGSHKLVCFDFRFEKFSFINIDEDMLINGYEQMTFFNNKGKLGAFKCPDWFKRDLELVFWVLEDAGKHKWSKSICLLPERVSNHTFVGMTGTGEIVLKRRYPSNSLYIYYYNIEGKTLTRVYIKGFDEFKHRHISIFLDYVESMKFI